MRNSLVIFLFAAALMSCGNNRTNNTNAPSTDSSSTLDMSRKSGNNTGTQDSSLKKTDSMKAKSDVVK